DPDPGRLRRLADRHHPVGRRRRLRAHEQRPLLRAHRHRGQRPPAGSHLAPHPLAARDRDRRRGVVPVLPRDGLPCPRRPGSGGREGRDVLCRLPDRALPGGHERRPGRVRRGQVRARLRGQHRGGTPQRRQPCCRPGPRRHSPGRLGAAAGAADNGQRL
ncbi:MAG: putative 4-hydroxybenzoyl-CoA thioesterase, partial [uncultured Nocardioidaceae bacterium]